MKPFQLFATVSIALLPACTGTPKVVEGNGSSVTVLSKGGILGSDGLKFASAHCSKHSKLAFSFKTTKAVVGKGFAYLCV